MKLSSSLISILLVLAPALISAAPTDATHALFARDPVCKITKPNQDISDKMAAATREAHAGENACPGTKDRDFDKSKDVNLRTRIKTACVDGWSKCVDERVKANNYCKQLGGEIDQGHKDAVTFCRQKRDAWKAKKP